MNAQATMSPYTIGADFCEAHRLASECAVAIARHVNVSGRDCSFRDEILPVWRANAYAYGFTDNPEARYAITHNACADIARHLEWAYGVRFTKRRSKSDVGQCTHATPEVAR